MSIAGASYTTNQDNSVSLRQTFVKQTFPADTVKRGIEKIQLRLQRVQNAATMTGNIVGLGSDNSVSEPQLTVWKAAGNGATHEIIIPVIVTNGSTVTATTKMDVGTGQATAIPMRLTVENHAQTQAFNGDASITSTTDDTTTFTATGTATSTWNYIRLRIRINGAFTASGDAFIRTVLGTLTLTVTQPLGNTTQIKVALFENGKPIAVSAGQLAYAIATTMTVYDFTFASTPIVQPNSTLTAIAFVDGSVSGWTDANTTIKISIDATASPYTGGYAEYYTAGAWSYVPTGIAGSYTIDTTDIYFAMFYTDALPTNQYIENISWDCDCVDQPAKITTLVNSLNSFKTEIEGLLNTVIQVEQNTPPVLEAFEAEYGSSPIPSNKLLVWQNTVANQYGGNFIYDSTVDRMVRNQNQFVRGYPSPIDFIQTSGSAFTAPAVGAANFANWLANGFNARFTIIKPTLLTIKLHAAFFTGNYSLLGFDYLIKTYGGTPVSGDLASVVNYGLAAGDGIITYEFSTAAQANSQYIEMLHPTELAVGSYTIYINFWLRSGTASSWVLGLDTNINNAQIANYPLIQLEGITKWQAQ